MNKDSFDKALKSKFSDTATGFDLETAWGLLEARRKRSKRRAVIWWFVFGAVLLAAGGGMSWWWNSRTNTPVASKTQTSTDQLEQAKLPEQALQPTDHAAQQAAFENAISEKTNSAKSQVAISLPNHKTPSIRLQTANSSLKSAPNPSSEIAEATPFNPFLENPSAIPHTLSTSPRLATTEHLDQIPQHHNLLQIPVRNFPKPNVSQTTAEKRKPSKTPKWSIGLQLDYGLNSVARQGAADYIQAREQEEQSLDFIQTGLDLRRRFKGPWFIQSGIQYIQWTDVQRSSQEISTTRPDTNLLLRQVKYPDGSIENFYGPGEVTVIHTREEERYNHYRQVEIPFLFGAALPLGKHWRLDLSTGIAVGLLSRASGSATIGSGPLPLSSLPYRNAGTLAFQSNIACLYQTPRWSAGLALMGRTGLNSSSTTGALFTEKRSGFGLGIVLRRAIP